MRVEYIPQDASIRVGEIVVTEGADRLRDGAEVQLPGTAPPAPKAVATENGKPATPGSQPGRKRRGNGTGSGRPASSS